MVNRSPAVCVAAVQAASLRSVLLLLSLSSTTSPLKKSARRLAFSSIGAGKPAAWFRTPAGDGALVAGGLLALTPQQVAAMESPSLDLAALGGGGLFKTVQAPYTPGSQTWAVLLVHPKGVLSATKRVRVVADKALLKP